MISARSHVEDVTPDEDAAAPRAPLPSSRMPGPRFRSPFGFLATMRRDSLGFLMGCTRRYGDVVCIRFPPFENYLVTDPRDIKHVLQENHKNYWKGFLFQKLKRIAGEGLVFSDGDLWKRQRQLVQPAFHRERIAALGGMMVERTGAMLERWATLEHEKQPLEVASEMSKLTLEIVTSALFGTDLGEDADEFRGAVDGGLAYANHVMNHLFTPPLFVPTPANLRGRRAIKALDRVVWKMIEQRRREGTDRGDLLSMLLGARDAETNESMPAQQLRDECVTFLVAGHETTAMSLAWAWHLLSTDERVEKKLHQEVDTVLGDRTPTLEDLPNLPYARMVLEESMRLYPPAWATSRQAYKEDEIGGYRIPAGATLTISPYVTQRSPALWDDPEHFEPERFSPERSAGRPEYAYFPFGGGPRRCVGSQFAMMEGQLALAMVARKLRLVAVAGHPVEPDPILTLRPRNGIPMMLRLRQPQRVS